jgi:hypothetical protein
VSRSEAHSVAQVLTALTTNEQVAESLLRYPQRDRTIERLEDDIARQRRSLIRELLAIGRANSAPLVAARMQRDASLSGLADT